MTEGAGPIRRNRTEQTDKPDRTEKPDVAERLAGHRSTRQFPMAEWATCFRWFEHDYPSPIACWNHHSEYELHLIRRGTGRVLAGDHIGSFSAGHVALIGPNLPHDWVSDLGPGESIAGRDVVLLFDGDRLRGAASFLPEMDELVRLLDDAARGIEYYGATARRAARLMERIGRSAGLDRLGHIFTLFTLLARAPASDRRPLASEIFSHALDEDMAATVDRILKYVFANIDRDVRMAEAARLAGMSEPSFSRFFKRVTGHNFVVMVRKIRVAQACRLLQHSDMPISSICFDVGFGNLSNFNRQFRAEMAMSPSQYRSAAPALPDA